MDKNTTEAARFIKALANPYRLQIATLLAAGEMNVSALNKHVRVSQPALSQHLSKLKQRGIITARRAQREIFYTLANQHALAILDSARDAVAPAKA